jgi:hypothetical protein
LAAARAPFSREPYNERNITEMAQRSSALIFCLETGHPMAARLFEKDKI